MVLTRANRRQLQLNPEDYDREVTHECRSCDRRSSQNSQSYGNDYDDADENMSTTSFGGPNYRPNDRCKRHRLPDGQEPTEVVSSYRRRK